MSNTTYTTEKGDTWTGISFKAYGTITKAVDIINANPFVATVTIFYEGIVLSIPIQDTISINKQNLPPWKR